VIVAGVTLKLRVKGTVTVRACGAEVPPGPVAVMVYVVGAVTGGFAEPEAGIVTPSSVGATGGLIVTEVAFVVAQVMVVV